MDFESVALLQEWITQFIETWNGQMAHPFNWTYRAEGLHGKALRRFCRWLELESDDVSCSFLSKQLLLTTNLIEQFSGKIQYSDWQYFDAVFAEKIHYVEGLIEKEIKPIVKKRAEQALSKLKSVIPHLPIIPQS